MTLLNPVLLALAAGVAVPLLLHLLHRSEGRRIAFPALRYLLRTEKDHARRIRTRQFLLLFLRMGVIVLAALAGARLVLRGGGSAHPPTAVAIVLDNSLSSGRVVGQGRVLDTLKARALEVLSASGPGDRFWILRAGEPWDIAAPLSATEARERVLATPVTGAFGDLTASLGRARGLLESSSLGPREIHLLSDLQASAFPAELPALEGLPVVVYRGLPRPGANRYVRGVSVGGGLPPRANRRTEVAVSVGGSPEDTASVPVRVVLAGQLRGAATTPVEGTAVLPAGPFPQGRLEGFAETDPDELRADDRFHISLAVEPPPAVATVGDPGSFVTEALAVLEEGGRIRRSGAGEADVVISEWGQGLESLAPTQRAVVVPGVDPALRTALNRRLREAGIDVTLEPGPGEETVIATDRTGVGLMDIRVRAAHAVRAGEAAGLHTWSTLRDGSPWLVEATAGEHSIVILGSRLDPLETDVPLQAAMVPLLEWLVAGAGAAMETRRVESGSALLLPVAASAVEGPAGTRRPVDGTHEYRFTGEPGIYTILAGEDVLDRVAVNPPLRESLLAPVEWETFEELLATATVVEASSPAQWRSRVFARRRGREVWSLLLAAALVLLLVESWVASSGGTARSPSPHRSPAGRAPVS